MSAARASVAAALALVCAPLPGLAQTAPWELGAAPPQRASQGASSRVGYEILGGFAGLVGGSVAVVAAGCSLSPQECPFDRGDSGTYVLYAAAAAMLALPGGVTVAGHLAGGDGGFGWSLLGTTAGLAVGIPSAALVLSVRRSGTAGAVGAGLLVTLLPIAGAILGYELSTTSQPSPRTRSAARVTPLLDLRLDGAIAGATVVF